MSTPSVPRSNGVRTVVRSGDLRVAKAALHQRGLIYFEPGVAPASRLRPGLAQVRRSRGQPADAIPKSLQRSSERS